MSIELQPMTRERMHELYQDFILDPDIFDDMELYENNKNLAYTARFSDIQSLVGSTFSRVC